MWRRFKWFPCTGPKTFALNLDSSWVPCLLFKNSNNEKNRMKSVVVVTWMLLFFVIPKGFICISYGSFDYSGVLYASW